MKTSGNKLVDGYLGRLDRSLRGLPAQRREEVIAEISSHIAEGRAELADADEAGLRNLLERLGAPQEIALEARRRLGLSLQPRWTDTAAIPLLLIGGVVVPVLGWIVGAIFLWMSGVWDFRDKLLATLIFPGGLGLPLAAGAAGTVMISEVCTSGGGIIETSGTSSGVVTERIVSLPEESCSGQALPTWAYWILLAAMTLAPILVAFRLARQLNRAKALEEPESVPGF
ncbi:MAG: HAAS signaling domain-containing protein [Actinomycetota bacterium]